MSETLAPDDPTCLFIKNDVNITLNRFSYNGDDYEILIHVIKTNFKNFVNESDGGAILILNSGFECTSVNFTECVSLNGGGGAIYITECVSLNVKTKEQFILRILLKKM